MKTIEEIREAMYRSNLDTVVQDLCINRLLQLEAVKKVMRQNKATENKVSAIADVLSETY